MANMKLTEAKRAKKDEFYTQWPDIEREMNAYLEFNPDVFRNKTLLLPCDDPEWSNFTKYFALHFEQYGLKKLISTSYAPSSNPAVDDEEYQPTLFEIESDNYDRDKSLKRGKIYTLDRLDINNDGKINIDDLKFEYLEGDGDFRSEEVTALRNEADMVITNPPFSLLRSFVSWITEGGVEFSFIGNQNAITYKEIFPLIMGNQMWLGKGFKSAVGFFRSPYEDTAVATDKQEGYIRISGVNWFTNIDHGRRHEPMRLMSMEENERFNKKVIESDNAYREYDNYEAIEVPFTNAIPNDWLGVMGVPISFLDKYSPEQFEILGMAENEDLYGLKSRVYTSAEKKEAYQKKFGKPGNYDLNASGVIDKGDYLEKVYQRIFIRKASVQD